LSYRSNPDALWRNKPDIDAHPTKNEKRIAINISLYDRENYSKNSPRIFAKKITAARRHRSDEQLRPNIGEVERTAGFAEVV
jgi:hypothetical protein